MKLRKRKAISKSYTKHTKNKSISRRHKQGFLTTKQINKLTRSQQRKEVIEVHGKDVRRLEFTLDAQPAAPLATKALKATIKSLCFPKASSDLFAYFFKVGYPTFVAGRLVMN